MQVTIRKPGIRCRKAAVAAFLVWCLPLALQAFSFTPISQDFAPSGAGATRNFTLNNDGPDEVAIRIRVLTRVMDETGKEVNEDASGDFKIYPSRVILKPHSIQVLKIRWVGMPAPAKELCYRVLVEQIPVQFVVSRGPESTRISILFRYLGNLYVVPPHAKPAISVTGEPATTADGKKTLKLVFSNTGTAHTLLQDLTVTLTSADGSRTVTLPPERLDGISGENVLPGGIRSFILPPEIDIPADGVKVEFTYEPTR